MTRAVVAGQPPTSPSSASTQTPESWHNRTHVGGGLDNVLIAESGGVEHHRAETQRDRFADQGLAGGVVEVHRGRHAGCPSGPRSISAQLPEQLGAVVEEELEGALVGVRS